MNSTTNEALQSLLKLEEELMKPVNKVRNAIKAIQDLDNDSSMTESLITDVPQGLPERKPKPLLKINLDKLSKEGYNHKWNYTNKILYFLHLYGEMYVIDMAKKILEMYPDIPVKEYKAIKTRLGYQAMILTNKGILEKQKGATNSSPVKYWIKKGVIDQG